MAQTIPTVIPQSFVEGTSCPVRQYNYLQYHDTYLHIIMRTCSVILVNA